MKKISLGLLCLCLLFGVSSVSAFEYTLAIEGGGTVDETMQVGDIVDLALDSTDLDLEIYGNVQIEYDPAMLEAVYVDESYDLWGFWTGWTTAPGNPDLCGGGEPYLYGTGLGSDRGDLYAAEYGDLAGPSAYIDNFAGTIRFYHINILSTGYYEPLRLGFRVLQTGTVHISVKSQAEDQFDWCDFDTETVTEFQFGAVYTAAGIVDELMRLVKDELNLPRKIEKTYQRYLKHLDFQVDRGHIKTARKQLAVFLNKVRKDLRHHRITADQAAQLLNMGGKLADLLDD